MYSCLRVLLPLNARPEFTFSRLAQNCAPPRCLLRRGSVGSAGAEGERVAIKVCDGDESSFSQAARSGEGRGVTVRSRLRALIIAVDLGEITKAWC